MRVGGELLRLKLPLGSWIPKPRAATIVEPSALAVWQMLPQPKLPGPRLTFTGAVAPGLICMIATAPPSADP